MRGHGAGAWGHGAGAWGQTEFQVNFKLGLTTRSPQIPDPPASRGHRLRRLRGVRPSFKLL